MKTKSSLFPVALATSIVLVGVPCASAATWNVDAAGSWNTAASWSGTVPNGEGAVVEFSFNITANRSITLDGEKTVGDLKIGDPTPTTTTFHSYTLGAGTPATSRLIFDQTGVAAAKLTYPITAATAVANTISAPILLNDDLEITSDVIATANPSQSLSGIITDGSGSFSITKKGFGLITLGNANSYDGGTFVTGGKITANSNLSFGGGAVTISSGTQVSLASTGSYANAFNIAGNGVSLGTAETSTANLVGALRYGNSVTSGTVTVHSDGARLGAITGAYGILNGPLAGSGALEINSVTTGHAGAITLNGDASAYTGTITVPQGTLKLGTAAIGGSLVMKDGTTLVLNNALTNDTSPVIGSTPAPKSLTLGNTTGVALYVDPSTTNPPAVNGDVTLNGINTVYLTNACAGTTSTILTYTGTLTGSVSNLALQTAAGTYRAASFNVDELSSPKTITLTMTSIGLTWTGPATGGNWNTTDLNWNSGVGTFLNGDNMTFDDTAGGTGPVTVTIPTSGVVAPNKITVNNPTRDYTISGAGKIAGAAALTKDGAGKLTIANTTANTFTGGVTLKNGTLQVLPAATLGSLAFFNMSGGAFSSSSTGALSLATNAIISGTVTLGDGTNTGAVTITGNHTFANDTNISVPVKGSATFTGTNRLPANLTASTPFSTSFNANLTFGGASTLTANTTITNTAAYNSSNAIGISGPLTDGSSSFSLTKEGVGRLTLSAANTFDGGTTINNGLIYAQNALSFGTGAVAVAGTMSGGGQALFSGAGVIPNPFFISGSGIPLSSSNTSGDGAIQLNFSNQFVTGPITLTGNARITCSFSSSNNIISGTIDDGVESYALDLGSPGAGSGCGTLTLTGTNTYGGGTNIYRTVLQAYSNNAFGTGIVTIGSGSDAPTIALATRMEIANNITISNSITLNSNGRTNSTTATQTWGEITAYPGNVNDPCTATVSGTVDITATPANGGHFAAQGNAANILRVTGAINSTVPVIIANGIVELGGGGTGYLALTQNKDTLRVAATDGISTQAVVAQGATGAATLDLNGYDQTLAGITRPTGSNAVSVTNNSTTTEAKLTLAPTAAFTYPGTFVTGTAALNLSIGGFAATTLTGASTSYSGTTTVTNGGILELTGTLGGVASSLVTESGATLRGNGIFGGNVSLGGGTTIDVNPAAGNLTAGGNINVTGPVTVNLTSPPTGPVVVISCTGTLTAAAGSFSAPSYPNASFTVVGKQVIVSVTSAHKDRRYW